MTTIGFDLDNTVINYDLSAFKYSQIMGFDEVRSISELKGLLKSEKFATDGWTRAQSWIYGEGLAYATIQDGLLSVMRFLANHDYSFYIVSHKSKIGPSKFGSIQFIECTLEWLKNSPIGAMFEKNINLFFEETRREKIQRIIHLNLDFFVDDLIEVIYDKHFPENTTGILYDNSLPVSKGRPHIIQNFFQLISVVTGNE